MRGASIFPTCRLSCSLFFTINLLPSRQKDQLGVVFDLQVCIDDLIEALALQSGVDVQKFRQAVTSLNSTLKGEF